MRWLIEWDDDKARSNVAKHGIAFEVAAKAFEDPNHYSIPDPRPGYEGRWQTTGLVDGVRVTFVAHTFTDRFDDHGPLLAVRIISARLATRAERQRYERSRGWGR